MKYRRINIFGGPGVGKSICTAKLFGDLKLHGYLIEQVSEYAKTWAHQKRSVDVYAQLYFLAKQVKAEVKEDSRGECIAKIHLKEDHISPSAIQAYGTRLLNDYPIKALVLNGIPFPKESSIAEWI